MCDFFNWLVDPNNINANIFGLITVVLSGLLSWLISALYYRKGNRNALRLNVIFPIKRVIVEPRSWKNYKALEDLLKSYDAKYLTRHEQNMLNKFLAEYKNVCTYNYAYVCAESLFSYFQYKLKQNEVDITPVPVIIEGEIVDYEAPVDALYLRDDLAKVIESFSPEYEDDRILVEKVKALFHLYCKECFVDKEFTYFDDFTFDEVLKQARIRNEWDDKLKGYKKVEDQLMQLSIFKD